MALVIKLSLPVKKLFAFNRNRATKSGNTGRGARGSTVGVTCVFRPHWFPLSSGSSRYRGFRCNLSPNDTFMISLWFAVETRLK